jgi:sirohydrochlorin ferrochelatase
MNDPSAASLSGPAQTALLLIAHGSRYAEANDDLHHIAAELRRRGEYSIVEVSYLELAEPTGDQAGARCVEQGARQVVVVPYFLSAGVHVQRDLTALCQRLGERFPAVAVRLADPLGRHPLLIDVVAARAGEAAGGE